MGWFRLLRGSLLRLMTPSRKRAYVFVPEKPPAGPKNPGYVPIRLMAAEEEGNA